MFFNTDFIPYESVYLQCFSGSNFPKLFVVSLFILPLLFFYKNKYFISALLVFLTIYIIFVYFIDRYYAPRYVYYAFPFYFIVYACAAYVLFHMKKIFSNNSFTYILLISLILLSFFNPFTVVNGLISEKNGVPEPNGGLVHRDTFELMDYLKICNFSEKDVLITANGGVFRYYYNYTFTDDEWEPDFVDYQYQAKNNKLLYDYAKIYPFKTPRKTYEVVKKYDKGWIIIDKDRNGRWQEGLPKKSHIVENKKIIFLKAIGGHRGYDVYRWELL